jgi:glycosyltransferase involved in cell wall biosynthesis
MQNKGTVNMMKLSYFAINLAGKFKFILKRFFPSEFLKNTKSKMITRAINTAVKNGFLPFERRAYPDGVNLIGFVKGEIGLGQGCRLLASAMDYAEVPFTLINFELHSMRNEDRTWTHKITNSPAYNINLIHLNPSEMQILYLQNGRSMWDKRYNIVVWLWELENFPEEWRPMLHFADEIWAPSEFIYEAARKFTDKPVYKISYPVSVPVAPECDRRYFGLPENCFMVLCMYDANSTLGRKNPLASIKAYKSAFPEKNKNVGLVIKVNNADTSMITMLRGELAGYENIFIIGETMDKIIVNSLISVCDAYISLHRAEGFGLILAEAMLLGKPCIATGWSSNTEFMTSENSCLVDYRMITIEEECGPYPPGQRWAEADTGQAAGFLRKLYADGEYYRRIAKRGENYIKENLNYERAAGIINARLSEILPH